MDKQLSPLKISFCTTCKGRLHHLKETLRDNLAAIANENAEIVLLDYGSENARTGEKKGDLAAWIKENFQADIDSGHLRFAQTEAEHWHASHAKNMAYRLATGDVLCSIDADNSVEQGFAEWLQVYFKAHPQSLVEPQLRDRMLSDPSASKLRGIGGRIAMTRESFMALGGYDETIQGWAGTDRDLARRALESGLKRHGIPPRFFGRVIQHSNDERLEHMTEEAREASRERVAHTPLKKLSRILDSRHKQGSTVVNEDGAFGCGTAYINLSAEPTILRAVPPRNEIKVGAAR